VIEKTVTDISEIEDAHADLRECIAATKALSERTDDLLQQHKARTEREQAGAE
jgi:hypothetical protein